jgi:hypothetical protein
LPLALLRAQILGPSFDPVQPCLCRRLRQADSLLRPWARRRERTCWPFFVDMRFLKPWRRLRTILLG